MRELIKKEQMVTIVPQDFHNTNNGRVTDVRMDGFDMELKYIPEGLIKNHVCDFYSLTDNGYLYFESYIKELNNNIISIANPTKHRFLQRRKFTRIKFLSDIELVYENITHKAMTLDLSAGGMKLKSSENIDIEHDYKVCVKLSDELEVSCKYHPIRIERTDEGEGDYILSGKFVNLSNIDRMTLIQYCMKKNMENINK